MAAKFRSQKGAAAKIAFRCKKISQPSGAAAKIPLPAAKIDLRCETISRPSCTRCENFRSCESPPWHTSAISQPGTTVSQLQIGCDFFHAWRPAFSQPKHHFEGCFAAAKTPLGTRVPVRRVIRPFAAVKCAAKSMLNFRSLRKRLAAAKSAHPRCEKNPSAAKRNSDPSCSF